MNDPSPLSRHVALSVRKRIFGGFAVVLLLLLVLAVVALRGMQAVGDGADRVSRDSELATASTEVGLMVGEARARVMQYALTATMDDQKSAQISLGGLDEAIAHGGGTHDSSVAGNVIAGDDTGNGDLRALATRYRATVDAGIAAVEARRATVEEMQAVATDLRTIVSAITTMVDREDDPVLLRAVAHLADSFGAADSAAARFVASRTPAEVNAAGNALPVLRAAIDALGSAAPENRRLQRLVKGLAEPLGRFAKALRGVENADEMARTTTGARDIAAAAVLHAAAERQTRAMESQGKAIAAMLADTSSARRLSMLTAACAMVIGLVLAILIGGAISRPILALTGVMRQLAEGALEAVIPNARRHDELGEMARAVEVFRDNAVAMRSLEARQAAERQHAETDKRAALSQMADTIETETGGALAHIRERTGAMMQLADAMSASADRTGAAAETAAGAAGHAMANAQTVASAAEQLTASIREIGGQVSQSAAVVGRAVTSGSETRATIQALNDEVEKIGAVADMIGEIAARTNLLALNATIEAARAGDAGKGFAVVASEVKQLATQTARSTSEISRHIAQVRSATGASVAAVARIEQTITEINAIAGSIAAAVEQQGAATAEIARNVSETASAANEMTARTTVVSTEASDTGRHAADVRDNVTSLNAAIEELRHSVIRVVRTSTTEVDRRASMRYAVDLPCRVTVDGRTLAARVADLSDLGAQVRLAADDEVRGGSAWRAGALGTLRIEGVALPLTFVVKAHEGDVLRLAFNLDAAAAAGFAGVPARLAGREAA